MFPKGILNTQILVGLASLVGFPGGSVVKNLPVTEETWVQSLGQEDPLEETVTHSSIVAQEIPWTEEPGRLQSMGSQKELDMT